MAVSSHRGERNSPEYLPDCLHALADIRDEDPERALEHASRAESLAPDSAEIRDTLAVVLLKNGELERALRTSERALAQQPENPGFLYHRAMILEAAGRTEQAQTVLRDLLRSDRQFGERAEAERLLAKLAQP